MSLDEIKFRTQEINEMGRIILRLDNLFQSLPEELQYQYSKKLLKLISEYYQEIKVLEKLVKQYRQNELENKLPTNLTIKKLERDLKKFY